MFIAQKNAKRKLVRYCAICAKKLTVIVKLDKSYIGGHYFFKVETGKGNQAEYWECNECYTN